MIKTALLFSSLSFPAWGAIDAHKPSPKVWFDGSVDKAFESAKKTNKPIFLYWGAAWCPPCNEIKSQVFSKPEFAGLMKSVVSVYLDGDSEIAQVWGEKLHASDYPTMLLLDPKANELLRISSAVSYEDFAATLANALSQRTTISQLISRAIAGRASIANWQIIINSEIQTAPFSKKLKELELLGTLAKLIDKSPAKPLEIRTILKQTYILEAIGKLTQPDYKNTSIVEEYLTEILQDSTQHVAARTLITYSAREVLEWFKANVNSSRFKQLAQSWSQAARSLRNNPNISTDVAL